MYIIDRSTSTQNATREGETAPAGLPLLPDLIFTIDIRHSNGTVAIETAVTIVAGDAHKELVFDGRDRVIYLPEFGKPVNYEPLAKEVKEFVEKCISDARDICLQEGCYYPVNFQFPEIDLKELSDTIKEGLISYGLGRPVQGIPE